MGNPGKRAGRSARGSSDKRAGESAAAVAKRLLADARQQLEALIDPTYVEKIRELVPTGAAILGVRVPAIRALALALCREQPTLDLPTVARLVDAACATRCREEVLLTLCMLVRFRRKFDASLWPAIDGWIDTIDNWEVCDHLAKNIAAVIVAKNEKLERDLLRWTMSTNFWRRRFALATTTSLNQGGRRNVELALRICEPLMCDPEPMVQKAVGWAIREASRHDAAAARRFVDSWRGRALPRVLRECRIN